MEERKIHACGVRQDGKVMHKRQTRKMLSRVWYPVDESHKSLTVKVSCHSAVEVEGGLRKTPHLPGIVVQGRVAK